MPPENAPAEVKTISSVEPVIQSAVSVANYDPRNPAFLVPFRKKGKYMVGREQALQKVRQQLLEGKPTSIGQTALEMRRELLGVSHPDTIASLKFVAKRLFANPLTAGRGKVLVEEYLRLIPRDHPARQELLEFLGSRKGFRKPGHGGHGKKSRKRR